MDIENTIIANGQPHHWLDEFWVNVSCGGNKPRCMPGSGIGYVGKTLMVYGGTAFRFPADMCFATEREAEADIYLRKAAAQ